MSDLDPRLNAIRDDAADRSLSGQVDRPRYLDPVPRTLVAGSAPLRRQPRHDVGLDTELLHGERVHLFEETDEGWAWVQLETDSYVGWCPSEALGEPGAEPTHVVSALRTFVFPGADLKLPPIMHVSFGSRVAVLDWEGDYALTEGGYVYWRHLRPLHEFPKDWVAVAERFLGTPYYWGGRTSLGLDCSALVQLALVAGGWHCPRDSDMQENMLGQPIEERDPYAFRRGDLVFWRGHVAIALGDGWVLHANGHHMETVIEPARAAIDRIGDQGLPITSVRRL